MSKPDVLMVGPYPDWEMPLFERDYVVHKLWLAADRAAFLGEVGPRIRAIATNGVLGASAELIDACPRLEIIACFGVGYDAIDIERARSRGVRVTTTPDVLTEDVADMAFALILASLRRIVEGEAFVRSGRWSKGALPLGRSLGGKRLGVLGFGRIGRAIARRALPFGMSVAYCDLAADPDAPHAFHADPVSLAKASDILAAATTGGAATRNLIGAAVFEALGPEGLFVNISRGSVVDEPALIAALE
ncbi:MAG: 2-hydroxyacid dehydrogenase, partial [Hyphomicrobiales bacterium]|nr:2-hydroxyacid dehydrogenase [Hyphomicrobiales bacterium]